MSATDEALAGCGGLTECPFSDPRVHRMPVLRPARSQCGLARPFRADDGVGRRIVTCEGLPLARGCARRAHLRRADGPAVGQEEELNAEVSSSQPAASGTPAGSGGARAGRGAGISVGNPRCRRIPADHGRLLDERDQAQAAATARTGQPSIPNVRCISSAHS